MERHEAIILNTRSLRAADRLITVLSPTAGKRELLAKGTRKIISKLNASLQPFARARIAMVPGRRYTLLVGVETMNAFPSLRQRLAGLAQAGFVVDVADALTVSHAAEVRLYRLVLRELERIDRSRSEQLGPSSLLALSLFALRAISVAGWHPDLQRCAVCQRPLAGEVAFLTHPLGFAHRHCSVGIFSVTVSAVTRRFLVGRFRSRVLPAIVPRPVASQVGRIAVAALDGVLERPLKSRPFVRAVARQGAPRRNLSSPGILRRV